MRCSAVVMMLILLGSTAAMAQELRPEDLQRMYDDALVQLKAAQDRKNELATENEKLHAQIAQLQQQRDDALSRLADARREAAELAKQTWYLRAHHAAWEAFIAHRPRLKGQWDAFFNQAPLLSPGSLDELIEDPG